MTRSWPAIPRLGPLTHLPKNKYCEICRLAKAKRTHRRDKKNRAEVPPPPEQFGEQCTAHLVFSANIVSQGIGGQKYAVMIYDRAIRWRTFSPTCEKDHHSALRGLLKHGSPKTGACRFHCDNAKNSFAKPLFVWHVQLIRQFYTYQKATASKNVRLELSTMGCARACTAQVSAQNSGHWLESIFVTPQTLATKIILRLTA